MKHFKQLLILSTLTLSLGACEHIDNPVDDVIADLKYINPVPRLKSWNSRETLNWFDQDKDGALNTAEFETAMTGSPKYRLMAAQSDLTVERYVKTDFKRADIDGNGQLSFAEFHAGRSAEGIAIPDQPRYSGLHQSLKP